MNDKYNEPSEESTPERMNPLIFIIAVAVMVTGVVLIFREMYSSMNDTSITEEYENVKPVEPIGYGATDDGIYYEIYEDHIRVFKYYNAFFPLDLVIPEYIEDLPVTEIAYYTFTFSGLNSITFENPDCVLMDDGETPPIAPEITVIGYRGSEAEKYAEKYGNKFVELK